MLNAPKPKSSSALPRNPPPLHPRSWASSLARLMYPQEVQRMKHQPTKQSGLNWLTRSESASRRWSGRQRVYTKSRGWSRNWTRAGYPEGRWIRWGMGRMQIRCKCDGVFCLLRVSCFFVSFSFSEWVSFIWDHLVPVASHLDIIVGNIF